MQARSLSTSYDDSSPTLVRQLHTVPMDRRTLPLSATSSGVVPAARNVLESGVVPIQRAAPAPTTLAPAPSPFVVEPAPPSEPTQLSRRRRSEVSTYRRLTIALAIGLAFAMGIAASLAYQLVSQAGGAAAAARAPHDAVTRTEPLRLDSATAKSVVDTKESPRPPKRAARAPRAPSGGEGEPESPADASLGGRDLLGEGLGE